MITLSIKRGVGENTASLVPFYNPISEDPRFQITDGQFEQGINEAGRLTVTLPPMSIIYNEIVVMKTVIVMFVDGTEYWRGRVVDIQTDYYKNRVITCEGLLNYLLDTYLPPNALANPFNSVAPKEGESRSILNMFYYYLNVNNMMADQDDLVQRETNDYYHQFYGATNGWTLSETYTVSDLSGYPTILDLIMDDLIEQNGGFLFVNGATNTITYQKTPLAANVESYISFGENMIDYEETIAGDEESGFYTMLVPLGKTQDEDSSVRLDISSVNSGKAYLTPTDSAGIPLTKTYGKIFHTETFDDIEDATKLKEAGQKYLDEHPPLPSSYTIRAVDRMFYTGAAPMKVGQMVHVLSAPHGISRDDVILSSVSLDLINPSNCEYTFGDPYSMLTKAQAKAVRIAASTRNKAQTAQATASSAKSSAAEANEKADRLAEEIGNQDDEEDGGSSGGGSVSVQSVSPILPLRSTLDPGSTVGTRSLIINESELLDDGEEDPETPEESETPTITLWGRINKTLTMAQGAQETADDAAASIPLNVSELTNDTGYLTETETGGVKSLWRGIMTGANQSMNTALDENSSYLLTIWPYSTISSRTGPLDDACVVWLVNTRTAGLVYPIRWTPIYTGANAQTYVLDRLTISNNGLELSIASGSTSVFWVVSLTKL